MSEDAVGVIRGAYEAFGAGDMPKVMELLANVEWEEAEGMPYGGRYQGAQSIAQHVLGPISTDVKGFSARPDEIVAVGENRALALGRYRGEGKAGAVDVPFAHLWTVGNGRITHFRQYADTHKFRKAVGA